VNVGTADGRERRSLRSGRFIAERRVQLVADRRRFSLHIGFTVIRSTKSVFTLMHLALRAPLGERQAETLSGRASHTPGNARKI
jgi:hypothetical protein